MKNAYIRPALLFSLFSALGLWAGEQKLKFIDKLW